MKKTNTLSRSNHTNRLLAQVSTATLQQSLETKKQLKKSLFQKVTLENVGPTVMSGRVVDVAVNPENN
jgi:hypothetical protein